MRIRRVEHLPRRRPINKLIPHDGQLVQVESFRLYHPSGLGPTLAPEVAIRQQRVTPGTLDQRLLVNTIRRNKHKIPQWPRFTRGCLNIKPQPFVIDRDINLKPAVRQFTGRKLHAVSGVFDIRPSRIDHRHQTILTARNPTYDLIIPDVLAQRKIKLATKIRPDKPSTYQ